MNRRDDIEKNLDKQSAAEWFVALDAGEVDQATNDAFLTWLNSSPKRLLLAIEMRPQPG